MTNEKLPDLLRRLVAVAETRADDLARAVSALDGHLDGSPDPLYLAPDRRQQFVVKLATDLGISETDLMAFYDLFIRYYKR